MGNRSPGWRIPENHPRGRITVQSLATSPCSRAIGRSSVRPIWPKGTTLSASAPPHPHSLLSIYGVALLSLGSPLSEFSSCGLAIRSRLFFGNLSFFTPRSTPQPRPPINRAWPRAPPVVDSITPKGVLWTSGAVATRCLDQRGVFRTGCSATLDESRATIAWRAQRSRERRRTADDDHEKSPIAADQTASFRYYRR
jgi:hypothetical protein